MRIPSQFNEDNLYRRRNRRGDSAQSYRRLARLVIALALVIVVMRQASRPAIYEVFFPGPTTNVAPSSGELSLARVTIEEPPPIELDAETLIIANELTSSLSPTDQLRWLAALSRWQTSRPIERTPPAIEATLSHLDNIDDVSNEREDAWREMILALQAYVSDQDGPTSPETGDRSKFASRPQVAAWISALDVAATNRVVDGSVWQSADFGAFYRFLDQAERLPDAGADWTGVLPLLQQSDVYRNGRVRFAGTVARAEQVDATDNPFGIEQYWQLWLRPRDGADRPLLAIVPAVPSTVAAIDSQALELEGPAVTMVGRFLKRLPYRSSIGADLAPVVVGRLVTAPVTESELAVAPTPQSDRTMLGRFWLTVAAATAIGIFLAAITMWRTSAMEKRARELRAANRKAPNEFLDGLRSATSETEVSLSLKDEAENP